MKKMLFLMSVLLLVAVAGCTSNHEHDDAAHDDEGRILRDNVYGSIDEDVWRRFQELRTIKNRVFFGSITDRTKEMYS